jgi:hypothetical protein
LGKNFNKRLSRFNIPVSLAIAKLRTKHSTPKSTETSQGCTEKNKQRYKQGSIGGNDSAKDLYPWKATPALIVIQILPTGTQIKSAPPHNHKVLAIFRP